MWFGRGRVTFFAKKNSEKAKLPQICISFGGSMPIAQIKRFHLTPPSINTVIMTVSLYISYFGHEDYFRMSAMLVLPPLISEL